MIKVKILKIKITTRVASGLKIRVNGTNFLLEGSILLKNFSGNILVSHI